MTTESFTSNASHVTDQLNRLANAVGNPAPALEYARTALARGEEEVWATEGGAIGEHWPAAADPASKINSMLLVASGALRNSLTGASGEVTETALVFGTSIPYARFHQYGTSKMPARRFLGVPPNQARRISDRLAQIIDESAR